MPRYARIDYPNLLQHVIARGIQRSNIFLEDKDREDFVERFDVLLKDTGTCCYAWALLDNHFHLLLRPKATSLANFMRRLLTGYAVSFNLRYGRSGHLFQNRYKSIVCDEDAYFLELIRYIHLNPVRAGIVRNLDELQFYPWSGHRQLLEPTAKKYLCEEDVLHFFSRRKKAARLAYREFLADGLQLNGPPKLSQGGRCITQKLDKSLDSDVTLDNRILGGSDFVTRILGKEATEQSQPSLDRLTTTVTGYYGLNTEDLIYPNKARKIVQAKSVICYIAIRHYRKPGVEVARCLGYSTSAASHATKRGRKIVEKDEALRQLINGSRDLHET
ncbi:transposase, partial [bacterium]|nr:transposase [bacterium]